MAQKKNHNYLSIATKIFVSLLITAVLFISGIVAILNTSFGLPFLQKSVERMSNYTLQTSEFKYNYRQPFTFYFKNLSIYSGTDKINNLEELNLTIAPLESILTARFVLKDLWLKGATITEDKRLSLPDSLKIKELSLENINLETKTFKLKNTDIQLANWQNGDAWGGSWKGSFMFSAQGGEFAEQSFSDILINGTRQKNDWEFWSATFGSSFGNINASASYSDNLLSFEQLSITDAKIQPIQNEQAQTLYAQLKPWLEKHQVTVNRLDLINISGMIQNTTVGRFNLTVHNLFVKEAKLDWQKESDSQISFNAESMTFRQWSASEILGEMTASKNGLNISTFTSKLMDNGFIALSGNLSPTIVNLSEFTLTGIDIPLGMDELSWVKTRWQALEDVSLNKLAIKRTNLTIPEPEFPVFIKDLNLRGEAIKGKKEVSDLIWQGEISLSATSAEVNEIELVNPVISAKVNQNKWQLESELPFSRGQLKLNGHLNTINSSHPWEIQGQGISVPNAIYKQWFNTELPLGGMHDLDIDLYGISVTKEAISYSLSGALNATLYNSTLQPSSEQPLAKELINLIAAAAKPSTSVAPAENTSDLEQASTEENFKKAQEQLDSIIALKAGKVSIIIDRGQITLQPTVVLTADKQITLQGKWDFVTKKGSFSSK